MALIHPDHGSSSESELVRSPLYQMVMLVLSVYVLVTLSVSTFLVSDPEIQKVFQVVDLPSVLHGFSVHVFQRQGQVAVYEMGMDRSGALNPDG